MAMEEIACCGLNCTECAIFGASSDPTLAEKISREFKEERNLEIRPETIRCPGCRGDRLEHWSSGCEILQCCVDKRGLENCSQCPDFPCPLIQKWAKGGPRYQRALELLKSLLS